MRHKKNVTQKQKKRSIFLRLLQFLPVVLLLYLLFALWNMQAKLSQANAAAAQVSAAIEKQKVENAELNYQLEHIEEYREQLARQNGYGKSGETVFKEVPGLGGEQ